MPSITKERVDKLAKLRQNPEFSVIFDQFSQELQARPENASTLLDGYTSILLRMAETALQPRGLRTSQESKYTTNGDNIVNRASGEIIPDEEPIFIMRARDAFGVFVLRTYLNCVVDYTHVRAITEVLGKFMHFTSQFPERMKLPRTVDVIKRP